VDYDGDAGDVPVEKLSGDGGDGVEDPRADFGMAVLMHGEVVCARGEEGGGGVDGAVEEDVVDGDGEERGEGL
jgi:hypothetical protein